MIWILCMVVAQATDFVDVEQTLVDELDRVMDHLAGTEKAPYYTAVALEQRQSLQIRAQDGTIFSRDDSTTWLLDVDLRVGSPELDSTHPLRGFSELEGSERRTLRVPMNTDGLRRALWRELDLQARQHRERLVLVQANLNVKVDEETEGQDFEPREPVVSRNEIAEVELDPEAWAQTLADISARLADDPRVHNHSLDLFGGQSAKTLVDTDGARIRHGAMRFRVSLMASTTAPDGDEVSVYEAMDVHDPADLPSVDTLEAWARQAVQRIGELHDAPRGEPYSGPVILEGVAAGVFFHEVLGHRVEGHRQKRDDEGKTFAAHVGRAILPDYIDVYDDPTLARYGERDLNGHYLFDDEGVAPTRAPLVEDGVFVGFLMGRSPVEGFPTSNGHGRRSPGRAPLARMGNTIIEASETISRDQMRKQLLAEIRSQNLEYGYIVEDIEGGFTLTGRTMPNAFNVRATASWRVYADGRPDELVRGIDLVGTPLVAFQNLLAAADDPQVFNGVCGAESGWVPVSAVAPSMLFKTLEFQRKEKGSERPPLLPKPQPDGAADAGGAP